MGVIVPRDYIGELVKGFKSFRLMHYERKPELIERLLGGQSPKVMVVACCDARVDPAILTDCSPGDLFVVRNVANLVPPCEHAGAYHGTSAALEFGVCTLGVEHVVVFGHAQCGGIRTLMQERGDRAVPEGRFIQSWMTIADKARRRVLAALPGAALDEQAKACEQAAITVSLENLLTFSWVRERVEKNVLTLHGWYFDLDAGQLLRYNPETQRFEMLE